MRNILIQDDVKLVESKIKQFEANTGCELLLVLANSSDEYPGAIWRFGLLSGFIFTFIFSLFFEFEHGYYWPILMIVLTILMAWVGRFPWAKRLALSELEIDRECFEKSVELFYTLGASKVSHKVTAMIMVSTLEKKIMVLVDEKLQTEITKEELDELIEIMRKNFRQGNMALGFVQSIDGLEQKILKDFGGKVSQTTPSELEDRIHFL